MPQVTVNISIDPDRLQDLDRMAEEQNRSRSNLIDFLLTNSPQLREWKDQRANDTPSNGKS